jgi:hypothetical protein
MIAYRLTGARCRCDACGETFNSVSIFDRHRVGSYQERGALRRCLSVDDMVVRGWARNARGFWIERERIDAPRRSHDLVKGAALGWLHHGT